MQDTPQAMAQALRLTHTQENALVAFQDQMRSLLTQKVRSTDTAWSDLEKAPTYIVKLELEHAAKTGSYVRTAALALILQSRS